MNKTLTIVVPMAGEGKPFKKAGFAFPKPLIDIGEKTMIEIVINNLKPNCEHKFIFICKREHFEKYDLYNVLKDATSGKFEVILLSGPTEGAACSVLSAIEYINNDNDLLIANADQYIKSDINDFLGRARGDGKDGLIMCFKSSHPKWSYVRLDEEGLVVETAEKKVISHIATVGLYYFRKGKDFVKAAQSMILKNIRHNNEFYVCPVYNELVLKGKRIYTYDIELEQMFGMGSPEDLRYFQEKVNKKEIVI